MVSLLSFSQPRPLPQHRHPDQGIPLPATHILPMANPAPTVPLALALKMLLVTMGMGTTIPQLLLPAQMDRTLTVKTIPTATATATATVTDRLLPRQAAQMTTVRTTEAAAPRLQVLQQAPKDILPPQATLPGAVAPILPDPQAANL